MRYIIKRAISAWLCVCLFLSAAGGLTIHAEESDITQEAVDITSYSLVTDSEGFSSLKRAFDGKESRPGAADNASMTLSYADGIGSLYILFHMEYGEYTVVNNDTGAEHICGQYEFLHEFIDLVEIFGAAPSSITLRFENGSVQIDDIYAFTPGETPDFVQKWAPPAEGEADMVLFSTHGDDEQLFFAGLLPYYANALDYRVQVVYLTDHRNLSDVRVHEMLNGLWAVGCDTYPVFGRYYDFLHKSMEETYRHFDALGWSREEMLGFVVEQIRRFKPLVTVGHDFAGEYSHGQHMVYADLLAEALEISNDPTCYPDLAEKFGVWDVPKAYFHLYEENPIVMDWDTPMEELGGMTPFEMTQKLGFPCHESQQYTWFNRWINGGGAITQASQIETYSPCLYGLYRTTVGLDTGKNDMFENLTPYGQQAEPEPVPEETPPEEKAPPETQPAAVPTPAAPVVPEAKTNDWGILVIGGVLILAAGACAYLLLLRKKPKTDE